MTDYLYGLPDADQMESHPEAVWEVSTDGQYEDGDGPWTVEEWTVKPSIDTVTPADCIVDDILERMADDDQGLGDNGDRDRLAKDPDVLAAAEALRQAIAAKIIWRWADKLVRTLTITLDSTGSPMLDGEPMYRAVQP